MERWPQFYITSKDANGDDIELPLNIVKDVISDQDEEVHIMSSIAKKNAEFAAKNQKTAETSEAISQLILYLENTLEQLKKY